MEAILQPRYSNMQVWHYSGGNCQTLEEELVLQNPPHDDVKDALASCMEIAVPPSKNFGSSKGKEIRKEMTSTRFGGLL